jgi:hypothetical protein
MDLGLISPLAEVYTGKQKPFYKSQLSSGPFPSCNLQFLSVVSHCAHHNFSKSEHMWFLVLSNYNLLIKFLLTILACGFQWLFPIWILVTLVGHLFDYLNSHWFPWGPINSLSHLWLMILECMLLFIECSYIVFLFLFLFYWNRVSLCSQGWPWTSHPPVSAPRVLGFQTWPIMLSFVLLFINIANMYFCDTIHHSLHKTPTYKMCRKLSLEKLTIEHRIDTHENCSVSQIQSDHTDSYF